MVKKNYNPFKMWGSYMVMTLAMIEVTWTWLCTSLTFDSCPASVQAISNWFLQFGIFETYAAWSWMWLAHMIVGFLAGWGIHSLFRRFSK